jgi:hypothetical protein
LGNSESCKFVSDLTGDTTLNSIPSGNEIFVKCFAIEGATESTETKVYLQNENSVVLGEATLTFIPEKLEIFPTEKTIANGKTATFKRLGDTTTEAVWEISNREFCEITSSDDEETVSQISRVSVANETANDTVEIILTTAND